MGWYKEILAVRVDIRTCGGSSGGESKVTHTRRIQFVGPQADFSTARATHQHSWTGAGASSCRDGISQEARPCASRFAGRVFAEASDP